MTNRKSISHLTPSMIVQYFGTFSLFCLFFFSAVYIIFKTKLRSKCIQLIHLLNVKISPPPFSSPLPSQMWFLINTQYAKAWLQLNLLHQFSVGLAFQNEGVNPFKADHSLLITDSFTQQGKKAVHKLPPPYLSSLFPFLSSLGCQPLSFCSHDPSLLGSSSPFPRSVLSF